jgi:hypothetical protein
MSEHNETLDKIRLAVAKAHEMLDKAQEGEVSLEQTQASISEAIQLIIYGSSSLLRRSMIWFTTCRYISLNSRNASAILPFR